MPKGCETCVQDIQSAYHWVRYWVRNAVLVVYALAVATVQNMSTVYYRVRNAPRGTVRWRRD